MSNSTPPSRTRDGHLRTIAALREIVDDPRHGRYRALLRRFGIDPALVDDGRPRLLFAEHPGSWLYPDDLIRLTLGQRLATELGLPFEVLQFDNDAFRRSGIKHYFTQWRLIEGGAYAFLVSPAQCRRWHGRTYGTARLVGSAAERIRRQIEVALDLFDASRSVDALLRLVARRHPEDVRRLIGPADGRRAAARWCEALRAVDLDAACRPLDAGLDLLATRPSWATWWRQVNSLYAKREVGRLDPRFDRYVLAIDDPERMARELARVLAEEAGSEPEAVNVAGRVDDDGRYVQVVYRLATRRFVAVTGRDEAPCTWDDVRRAARLGRSAGPTGLIEYLMFAATGHLMLADAFDGGTPFEQRTDRIHRRAIGRPFPWVSAPRHYHPPPSRSSGTYLDRYAPSFERRVDAILDPVFRPNSGSTPSAPTRMRSTITA